MMTYKEAMEKGYKNADQKYERGYVSRKSNVENLAIMVAEGNRKGQLYVLIPCFSSSRYCIRQYLTK